MNEVMDDTSTSRQVHAQYESYPYPMRDPKDERKRLVTGSPSHLFEVDHYVFGGRRDFSQPFEALVAGGGTGDACIMLAQQLADAGCPGRVTYLDLSAASRAIAEARAEVRGLDNIRFVTGAIEDIAALCPGPYDYIDCCGVLHHMADPDAGLRALTAQLAEDSGLGIMLYGTLGRTGVYHVQEAMRLLADTEPDVERLKATRALLKELPDSNWLKRNPFVGDHKLGGDSELYDLLLHRRDRSYTVPEVAALLDQAGLEVSSFIPPLQYDPDAYLSSGALRARTANLPPLERAALAELLSGALNHHVFYAVRKGRADSAVAQATDIDLVPVYKDRDPEQTASGIKPNGIVTANLGGHQHRAQLPALAPVIARRIDGKRTIAEILDDIEADPRIQASRDQIETQYRQFYHVLSVIGWLTLRAAR